MTELPSELLTVKEKVIKALGILKPADNSTRADKDFLFKAQRTDASDNLPSYYLVYFLLAELLGFRNLGQFEKISWSIPVDYKGEAYLIEHRKFGIGVFAKDKDKQKNEAEEIAALICKGVKIARPYFSWLAEQAVKKSELNVTNQSRELYERFEFLLAEYKKMDEEATRRKDEFIKTQHSPNSWSTRFPAVELRKKANWLALSAIEAFFSWTEHIFIHIAILSGVITKGDEVAELAGNDWLQKYKTALPITDKDNKLFFDQLLLIRKQLRNFVAHGAFGKEGEAFSFHSKAGAVPVTLDETKRTRSYSITSDAAFKNSEAIAVIESFIEYLWSGDREPAKMYIQGSLPLILTMAADGTYAKAMSSVKEMDEFLEYMYYKFDQAANMDW